MFTEEYIYGMVEDTKGCQMEKFCQEIGIKREGYI